MLERFQILEDLIKSEYRKGPLYYFPNAGNWGDGLIRYGTLEFFKDTKLTVKELSDRKKDRFLNTD